MSVTQHCHIVSLKKTRTIIIMQREPLVHSLTLVNFCFVSKAQPIIVQIIHVTLNSTENYAKCQVWASSLFFFAQTEVIKRI